MTVGSSRKQKPIGRRAFLKASAPALAIPALLRAVPSVQVESDNRFLLAGPARTRVRIVRGSEDNYAAQRLATSLKQLTGEDVEIAAEMGPHEERGTSIVLGSAASSKAVGSFLSLDAAAQKLGPEGFFLKTIPHSTPVLLLAGGDRVGTIYAVNELINSYLESDGKAAWVPPLSQLENPALRYRIFWTWDHSTNWELGVAGFQEDGCQNPYMKRPETFLEDYKKVVDYMSSHKLNGLIIWGFLRDSHGGVKASQELVRYADERGVRILPGIGTSFYGGFYYEGDHPFNVDTWLSKNPIDLRFLDDNGKRLANGICPSKAPNQTWLKEGAEWLFTTFPGLGGVNLENGDFMSCQTEDCQEARRRAENDPNFYWDMMVTQLPVIEAGNKVNPGAWYTYATYTGFSEAEVWQNTPKDRIPKHLPRFIQRYPSYTICQWTYSGMVSKPGDPGVDPSLWPKELKPPITHSIGLLHQGSQWWNKSRWWATTAQGGEVGARYEEIADLIRYTAQRCSQGGLEGLEILAEVSPVSPQNELNYLALEEFCWHPNRSMEGFIEGRLPRIYGSRELARRFVQMVTSDENKPQALIHHYNEALELAEDRSLSPDHRQRWDNLAKEMARRLSLVNVS